MTQSLAQKLDALAEQDILATDLPSAITDNLAPRIVLRPYQVRAMERWLFYMGKFVGRPPSPHLLFHMATGSGKTVLMAALILDLYKRGYRNFLFFVNSTQIIQKTRDNFLNQASAKYLFAPIVRVDGRPVNIRACETFGVAGDDAVNIHFTTIQGLHRRMQDPRENVMTIEDLADHSVVMISDEAHHLNAETQRKMSSAEAETKASWEGTVTDIFGRKNGNILLEFTATADLEHPAIREKYQDRILYDYPLRQFREDGYSKDIELRQADLSPRSRMLQAMILSQYRRKVAEVHGVFCKPVILMKSRTIAESAENETAFRAIVEGLTARTIEEIRASSENDETLVRAFDYILDERGMQTADFALELQGDFSAEKVVNVNKPEDLEKRQIELNTLEDRSSETRVIFAVDKLNEGWDVLNLFDIVRLYDTRDGKNNSVGRTTMAEAQLIGRGARYFPFRDREQPEMSPSMRKYDRELTNPLRILEEIHYHCSHNPRYIQDIKHALRNTGMWDDNSRTVTLKIKDSFRNSEVYRKGHVWVNERIRNRRQDVSGLNAYRIDAEFDYPSLMTGKIIEDSAFGSDPSERIEAGIEPISRNYRLVDFGRAILGFAMDASDFFHFNRLKAFFPKLESASEFIDSKDYLGQVRVSVRGLPQDLENLSAREKLSITKFVLQQIRDKAESEARTTEFLGKTGFVPRLIRDSFTDRTLKLSGVGESSRSWIDSDVPGLQHIDLNSRKWHVYDDNYGTDQEKLFVRYFNDQADRLDEIYDEFYLVRNEKAVRLFSFANGQAFEPDYVLFLRRMGETASTILQVFIEPKGDHLLEHDGWKQDFLEEITGQGRVETIFQGRDYSVYGLPFFNDSETGRRKFREAFERFLK